MREAGSPMMPQNFTAVVLFCIKGALTAYFFIQITKKSVFF